MRAFRPRVEHSALHGITAERVAEMAHVHVTTARRWKRGEEPPYAALLLIELLATGNLGVINPAWQNWRVVDDKLFAPTDANGFTGGDIMSIPWIRQMVRHLQSEARLPRQSDWISGRWETAREIAVNE